jgi:hypothetical protein
MERDINSETAEKIMGWYVKSHYLRDKNNMIHGAFGSWDPHNNLNQAMMIVEKINDLGYTLSVEQSITDPKQFKVTFSYYKDGRIAVMGAGEDREGNLSKAICLAALDTFEDHEDYWTTPEGIEQSR